MTNFFSKNLYVQGLKKIKISGIAFSLIIILLNAFIPIIGIIDSSSYSSFYRGLELVEPNMVVPFCMLVILLVPILAHDMFSFLNERNQSDFYHSIPQKRPCVYISFTAAVLTWAFVTIFVSTLLNAVLWSLASGYTFTFRTIILGMLPFLVLSIQIAGVMILAMTVTGTKISNFLVAILFLLFFRSMSAFCVTALDEIAPILNVDYGIFKYFGLEFFLPFSLMLGIFDGEASVFVDAKLQIYSLIVGILFLVLAGIAYNKRRSESASKSAPSKLLQHIYRFAVTLPFVFMVAFFIIVDGVESYQIILVIIAVLVYVLYELITTKKIKNVVRSLPLMIIPVVVTVLMVSGIYVTSNVIYNDKFTADEVDSFCFTNYYSSTYERRVTDGVFVKSERAGEILADALEYSINGEYHLSTVYERVLIKLDSGRVMARNLHIPDEEYKELQDILFNSPDFYNEYLKLPHPNEITTAYTHSGLSGADTISLYRSFYEEYNTLSYSDKLRIKNPKGEYVSVGSISLSGYMDGRSYSAYYNVVFELLPKTAVMYINLLEGTGDYAYYKDGLKNAVNDLAYYNENIQDGDFDYAYGSISLSKVVGRFDNGSVELIYKDEDEEMVSAVYEILSLILSDEGSFDYSDPEKLYRLNFYVDIGLSDSFVEKIEETVIVGAEHTSADLIEGSSLSLAPSVDVTVPEVYYDRSRNFYASEELFVSISDENMAKISLIIHNTNVEKIPNKDVTE